MHDLIREAWRLYIESGQESPVVKPSIPILYFGDHERYQQSPTKVITVALNPSRKEFPDEERFKRFPGAASMYPFILEGRSYDQYTRALNAYFRTQPYRSWFGWFEEVLQGMDASYYDGRPNTALHTDICSPLATDPTWSGLGSDQVNFASEGVALWHQLVDVLVPDVILVSVARQYRDQIAFANADAWQPLHTITRDDPSKRPYHSLVQRTVLPNGKQTTLVFGPAAQQPFATLTKSARQQIGNAIRSSLDG